MSDGGEIQPQPIATDEHWHAHLAPQAFKGTKLDLDTGAGFAATSAPGRWGESRSASGEHPLDGQPDAIWPTKPSKPRGGCSPPARWSRSADRHQQSWSDQGLRHHDALPASSGDRPRSRPEERGHAAQTRRPGRMPSAKGDDGTGGCAVTHRTTVRGPKDPEVAWRSKQFHRHGQRSDHGSWRYRGSARSPDQPCVAQVRGVDPADRFQAVPSNPSGLDFRSNGSHHVGSWNYSNRCLNRLISLGRRVGSVQSQYPVQRVFADPRCHHRHVRDRACRRPGQVTSQALGLSLSIPKFAMNDPVTVCAQAH